MGSIFYTFNTTNQKYKKEKEQKEKFTKIEQIKLNKLNNKTNERRNSIKNINNLINDENNRKSIHHNDTQFKKRLSINSIKQSQTFETNQLIDKKQPINIHENIETKYEWDDI